MQFKDDGWRSNAITKVALNPDHPQTKFNIGNLETLAGDVHHDLLVFFEENYSANQMGLAVLTNQTLDEMESWKTHQNFHFWLRCLRIDGAGLFLRMEFWRGGAP